MRPPLSLDETSILDFAQSLIRIKRMDEAKLDTDRKKFMAVLILSETKIYRETIIVSENRLTIKQLRQEIEEKG